MWVFSLSLSHPPLLGAPKKIFHLVPNPAFDDAALLEGTMHISDPKKYIFKLVRPTHRVLRFTSHRYVVTFSLTPSVLIDVFYVGSIC